MQRLKIKLAAAKKYDYKTIIVATQKGKNKLRSGLKLIDKTISKQKNPHW
ncbi:MAG: hypothetical protein JSV59_07125 [Flavobacteriaceae bacterium]|nr:MAG: hypothetical protein JSV59_07125 [Flavobacteriaceae bacterium]